MAVYFADNEGPCCTQFRLLVVGRSRHLCLSPCSSNHQAERERKRFSESYLNPGLNCSPTCLSNQVFESEYIAAEHGFLKIRVLLK